MKPTNEELRVAIEAGIDALHRYVSFEKVAILHAHLETLDEERAFLEAARAYCERVNSMGHMERDRAAADAWDAMRLAYRALVAKREGKP
jgi:hypothetical protein